MSKISFDITGSVLNIKFSGDYQKQNLPDGLFEAVQRHNIKQFNVDFSALGSWDSSLLAVLMKLYEIVGKDTIKIKFLNMPSGIDELLKLALTANVAPSPMASENQGILSSLGDLGVRVYQSFLRGFGFIFENLRIFFESFFDKTAMRNVDFLFALEDCGPKAVPIVALISFMVGLILAFVGAIQLQLFGAEVYVASLVTIGMTRIMGAIMVGIIMAGRTGASFAATIGTIQVNEEIDALKTMGISTKEFLVLPRLKALVITMPLLTMFADFAGILGGATVGILALNIPSSEFFKYAYNAWFLKHFLVGLFHALVFGFIISMAGCYFGINCGRDADSVGKSTTSAVVYSIVWMIVATGIITFCLQRMGI